MRISTTGMIEWLNQVNTGSGTPMELMAGSSINSAANSVYALFIQYSVTPNVYAILKYTFNEGKLVWSKYIPFIQNRAECASYGLVTNS